VAAKKKTDLSAALTGLVLGAVTIFLLLTSIVMMTNAHYRDLEKSEGAAPAGSSAPAPHP
jgi:hypothetical protein